MVLGLIQEKQSLTERLQALELDNWTMRKTLETVHVEALKQEAKERDLMKQLDTAKGEVMSAKVSTLASTVLSDTEHVPVRIPIGRLFNRR
jgi:ABC-type uncharacterized transport system substrate-binding protein